MHVRPVTTHHEENQIIMDGHVVGKLVAKHIGKQMSLTPAANAPQSNFDPSLTLPGVAFNF